MPCPFPGMDPYLEMQPDWSDFHLSLLIAISNHLLAQLLPKYDVRFKEYLMLSECDLVLHRRKPNVAISTDTQRHSVFAASSRTETTVAELEYPEYDPNTQRRLEVIPRGHSAR